MMATEQYEQRIEELRAQVQFAVARDGGREGMIFVMPVVDRLVEAVLSPVLDFENDGTGENDFCECTMGHLDMKTVCRTCFAIAGAHAVIRKA